MKIAVINFSGNVGKTTVSKHLLMPRMTSAVYFAVESINSGEEENDIAVRGKAFGALSEELLLIDDGVVDVGASNVEDFVKHMQQYRGSHADFDYFVVPVVKDAKQIKDTIATIQALNAMGVESKRIRVVFNKLESDEKVEDVFHPIFAFHDDKKMFTLKATAVIHENELYERLGRDKVSIHDVLNDGTDWKAKLKEAKDQAEKETIVRRISMGRLAQAANENLDTVFKAVTGK